jgi:hypothetical protein
VKQFPFDRRAMFSFAGKRALSGGGNLFGQRR